MSFPLQTLFCFRRLLLPDGLNSSAHFHSLLVDGLDGCFFRILLILNRRWDNLRATANGTSLTSLMPTGHLAQKKEASSCGRLFSDWEASARSVSAHTWSGPTEPTPEPNAPRPYLTTPLAPN
ncbi:hypothetical protein VTK56DRAFT_6491 [Thermocarpiscus australiensis]